MRTASTILFVFISCLATSTSCAAQTSPLIIDGELDDWHSIGPALIDPMDAADAAVDFGEVRIAHTKSHVHLLVDFGRTVNAQGLDGFAMILLDADGDPATGRLERGLPGVDLIIDLSPPNANRPDRNGMGMGVRSTTYVPDPANPQRRPLSVYDVGMQFAPTHASRRIEFRLDRGSKLPETADLFLGRSFSMKLVFNDLAGNVADETAIMQVDLSKGEQKSPTLDAAIDPMTRKASTDLRIMNWNVLRGANFTNPDPFARTIAAINPDVILLQELPETTSSEQLKAFLALAAHDVHWNVALGAGGGDLRCAIASKLPMQEALQSVPMPDQPDRTLRCVGAVIEHGERRLLTVAVHLRCCGRAGGPEDQIRLTEVRTLSEAMLSLMKQEAIDGVVIAGDFNLVGSRDPAEVMAAGLDLDRSALRLAHPLGLDGLSHVTWADPMQPFAPGRLDLLMYSDSSLEMDRTFIYDSSHLSARWLESHTVKSDDSREASDHLPVIADLRWIGAADDGNN